MGTINTATSEAQDTGQNRALDGRFTARGDVHAELDAVADVVHPAAVRVLRPELPLIHGDQHDPTLGVKSDEVRAQAVEKGGYVDCPFRRQPPLQNREYPALGGRQRRLPGSNPVWVENA